MKKCSECLHFKNEVCTKNQKNGYGNCKKYKAIPIETLKQEVKELLLSGNDKDRLDALQSKIRNFEGY